MSAKATTVGRRPAIAKLALHVGTERVVFAADRDRNAANRDREIGEGEMGIAQLPR